MFVLYLRRTLHENRTLNWEALRSITPSTQAIVRGEAVQSLLTLILLTWRIWWAPNNASRWDLTRRLKG